jgi:ElaB/YqjD/DUF883 family membrane-anchored ribosome-binding protein
MDQSTRDVQQNRERTRAAITEKLELLEESVRGRVESAKTAVKQNFDIRYHVNHRPWQMFGLSIMAGFLIGRWAFDRRSDWQSPGGKYSRAQAEAQQLGVADASQLPSAVGDDLYTPPTSQRPKKPSWAIFDQFHDEIETLKGAAIAAVVSVVSELLKSVTASLKESARSLTDQSRAPTTERGQASI